MPQATYPPVGPGRVSGCPADEDTLADTGRQPSRSSLVTTPHDLQFFYRSPIVGRPHGKVPFPGGRDDEPDDAPAQGGGAAPASPVATRRSPWAGAAALILAVAAGVGPGDAGRCTGTSTTTSTSDRPTGRPRPRSTSPAQGQISAGEAQVAAIEAQIAPAAGRAGCGIGGLRPVHRRTRRHQVRAGDHHRLPGRRAGPAGYAARSVLRGDVIESYVDGTASEAVARLFAAPSGELPDPDALRTDRRG